MTKTTTDNTMNNTEKITKKQVREASDMQLIVWIQDINKEGHEQWYSTQFQKIVHDEICKRGDELTQ